MTTTTLIAQSISVMLSGSLNWFKLRRRIGYSISGAVWLTLRSLVKYFVSENLGVGLVVMISKLFFVSASDTGFTHKSTLYTWIQHHLVSHITVKTRDITNTAHTSLESAKYLLYSLITIFNLITLLILITNSTILIHDKWPSANLTTWANKNWLTS